MAPINHGSASDEAEQLAVSAAAAAEEEEAVRSRDSRIKIASAI